METEVKGEAQETQAVQEAREKKEGSAVLTPDETPSYKFGITLGSIVLGITLLMAAFYFHIINL